MVNGRNQEPGGVGSSHSPFAIQHSPLRASAPRRGDRVVVGMSGGVDSSVAAALLVEAGYEVIGVSMRLWGDASGSGCCSLDDFLDARRVAAQLGIPFYVMDFRDVFTRNVVDPFVADYLAGSYAEPVCTLQPVRQVRQLLGTRARARGAVGRDRALRPRRPRSSVARARSCGQQWMRRRISRTFCLPSSPRCWRVRCSRWAG